MTDTIQKIDMRDERRVEELLSLQTTAYRLEAKLIGFDEIPPLADTLETLRQSSDTFYGYLTGSGLLAGAVAVEEERPDELTLTRMMVHPDFFRRGIATRLIEHVFALYPDYSAYIVSTGSSNEPAMRLYRRFGFAPFRRESIAPGVELSTMRLRNAARPTY